MTDQQCTPNVAQVRLAATFPNENFSLRGVDFDRWLAGIKMTERLFMLAQIMDVADFDPGQKDEYGRTEIPAYTVIDVHELNEIARLEDHEFMAITVEDLEKHASMIEAAAEQRGAVKALQDAAKDWRWSAWADTPKNPIAAANYVGDWISDRAEDLEGDE